MIPGGPPLITEELAAEAAAGAVDVDEGAPPEENRTLEVLRNKPFLALWLAQASTQIGGNMVLYGLTVLVFSLTNSTSAVSLLILTFLVPAVLFSAVAGVYVDRLDRRLILIVTNLLRAVMFALLFFVGENLIVILVLNALISTVTTFFAPAEAAMIPVLVKRSQLLAANGIFTVTLNAAFAIGFALLGPLVVNLTSPQALLLVVAAFYLLAMVLTITLPSVPPTVATAPHSLAVHEASAAAASTFGQLREGIAFIRNNHNVTWSLIYLVITASLIGVLGVVGPAFANQALGLSPKDFVVIVLPLGIGVVVGILLLNAYGKMIPRRRSIEAGLILLGIFLGLLAAAGPITRFLQHVSSVSPVDVSSLVSLLSVVIVLAFLAGIAYSSVAIPAQTQLQEDLPQEVRGRVFGVLNMLISTASFLPIIVVGPIADWISTTAVVFVVAVAITVSGILSAVLRRDVARG
ncbi:MAG: MFS transporter [Candidatus Limnocylindrales bacterium]|jgi:MFS family permease